MNILDNIKSLLFCFHTFGVRRTIYVLDSENQPGSGALGLTGDVWHQEYKNQKDGVKNYLTYSFNRLLKISLSWRYRAPDPHPCTIVRLVCIAVLTEVINVGSASAASPDQIVAPDPDHKRRLRFINKNSFIRLTNTCKYVYINIPIFFYYKSKSIKITMFIVQCI